MTMDTEKTMFYTTNKKFNNEIRKITKLKNKSLAEILSRNDMKGFESLFFEMYNKNFVFFFVPVNNNGQQHSGILNLIS